MNGELKRGEPGVSSVRSLTPEQLEDYKRKLVEVLGKDDERVGEIANRTKQVVGCQTEEVAGYFLTAVEGEGGIGVVRLFRRTIPDSYVAVEENVSAEKVRLRYRGVEQAEGSTILQRCEKSKKELADLRAGVEEKTDGFEGGWRGGRQRIEAAFGLLIDEQAARQEEVLKKYREAMEILSEVYMGIRAGAPDLKSFAVALEQGIVRRNVEELDKTQAAGLSESNQQHLKNFLGRLRGCLLRNRERGNQRMNITSLNERDISAMGEETRRLFREIGQARGLPAGWGGR